MKKEIENAIKVLAEKINADIAPDDALRFSQAALNLSRVLKAEKLNGENDEKA